MVERLYNSCEKAQADIGICFFDKVYDDFFNIQNNESENGHTYTISGREVISKIYHGEGEKIAFTAWNKMYKKELFIFNNIEYPINRYHEDTFTTYQLLYNADKVTVVTDVLYYYRIRPTSIMTSLLTSQKVIDSIDAHIGAVEFFFQKNDEQMLEDALNCYFVKTMRVYFCEIRKVEKNSRKQCVKYILEKYSDTWIRYHKYYKRNALKKFIFRCFNIWIKIIT